MMNTGNKRWAWLLAMAMLPFVSVAQDSTVKRHEFSLQQAIDYATKNNVQVKNALIDVQIQQQTNREVTGTAYPQISANGSLTYNYKLPVSLVPAEFIGGAPGTFAELAFGTKWNSTGGIALNQILFDGQVFTGLQARKTLIDFQEKNVEITEELIRFNLAKVYYTLAVSKTQVSLIDSSIKRLEDLAHDTKALYENGFAEKLDIDRVNVQLANIYTSRKNLLNEINNGYVGLKVLMGMPIREQLVLTDSVTEDMVKADVLDASQFDYTQRLDYQYADLGIRLNEYDVQRYKMSKIPTLSLNGYYNKNAQRNSFDFFKSGTNWFNISAFTLNLNVPIFSGFSNNARIAKARLALRQSVNAREALKINIDSEIEQARNTYTFAVAEMDNQRENMQLAETVFDQTKKKFEAGTGSQTEINTAQVDLNNAQSNYISALLNAVVAKTEFLKATGKL